MKSIVAAFLAVAAFTSAVLIARAQTTMPQTQQMIPAGTVATLVCRPAKSGEDTSATASGGQALRCKAFDNTPVMSMKPRVMAMPNGEKMWNDMQNAWDFETRL
jgi:hypothetical protein